MYPELITINITSQDIIDRCGKGEYIAEGTYNTVHNCNKLPEYIVFIIIP